MAPEFLIPAFLQYPHTKLCVATHPRPREVSSNGAGTDQGPPVCMAPTLKKQASSTLDLNIFGV
jgi:hypothetical protein